jgi:hypothetical protein
MSDSRFAARKQREDDELVNGVLLVIARLAGHASGRWTLRPRPFCSCRSMPDGTAAYDDAGCLVHGLAAS